MSDSMKWKMTAVGAAWVVAGIVALMVALLATAAGAFIEDAGKGGRS